MSIIRVGGEQAEFLAIHLLSRPHPDSTDYHDANWLRAQVEVAAGGFYGSVTGNVRAEEIAGFHEQLSRVFDSLKGTAEWKTLEDWLSIAVTADHGGHMRFDCRLQDQPGIGNTLRCTLEFDQTFIRPLLGDLRRAMQEFPVLGSPPG
ncbi:MAG TPA: hypothetical protein VJ739_10935 [Gemmataceae bacterium]|nr:hypothetical protein [Gemmataceae bacterium]